MRRARTYVAPVSTTIRVSGEYHVRGVAVTRELVLEKVICRTAADSVANEANEGLTDGKNPYPLLSSIL